MNKPMLLLALLTTCAAPLCAQNFEVTRTTTRRAALFQTAEAPAPKADDNTFAAIEEKSKWRGIELEAWGGVVAAKRSMITTGLGVGFHLLNTMSLVFRLDYDHNLGSARDFRPQIRQGTLEAAVRFHVDFAENVAFYGTHGINLVAQFAYFQLDETRDGTDLGVVTSLGLGTVNSFGLEFGNKTWRGFVETGFRTQFFFIQDSDERAVRGYEDDIRKAFRFQWLAARLGVRLYF
ncbi:MAG: hypothetical protein IPP14_12685 [Planctomycetes bacterium]|nr:hypothetical protein [Planctomycetota bacterium]